MYKRPKLVLIFVWILVLPSLAAPLKRAKPVQTSNAGGRQPVDELLLELERVHLSLNRVYAFSEQGFSTAGIEQELPFVERGLNLIKQKLLTSAGFAEASNLQLYDVMMDDHSAKLEIWKSQLMGYSKELVRLNKDIKASNAVNDSILRTKAIDSSYNALIRGEIASIKKRWNEITKRSQEDASKIRRLQARVSADWFVSIDLQDRIAANMNAFWAHMIQRQHPFILSERPLLRADSDAHHFASGQLLLLYSYLGHTIAGSVVLTVLAIFLFLWQRKLKSFAYPVASALIPFALAPFLRELTPTLYLGVLELGAALVLCVLLRKSKTYMSWLAFTVLFILYFILSNFFRYQLGVAWLLVAISLASCYWGPALIRGRSPAQGLFIVSVVYLCTLLSAVSVVAGLAGWTRLSVLLGMTGIYGVMEAFVLRAVVQLLKRTIILARFRAAQHLRRSLEPFLVFGMVAGWTFTFLNNLNVYDYLQSGAADFLNSSLKVGNTAFTPGNLLLFFLILYVSSLLQKFTGYFFGEVSGTESSGYNAKGSKLAIVRLILLVAGFLFAVAASGLPVDKITILLGALGVGIGLGLQNIVHNLVSGIILIFERPFQIGDLVEVGTRKGRVKDIGIRSSKLVTGEGSEVIVPNGDLLSERVVNWTFGNNNVRVEIVVKISLNSDIELTKRVIDQQLIYQRLLIKKLKPEIFIHNITETGIELKVLTWISDVHEEQTFRSDFLITLYSRLREQGIQMI